MPFEAETVTARLQAEFPGALRSGQVVGYFQPEIELSTGRLVAAELLARWEHPGLGLLPPATFLPVAAELGLMGELSLTQRVPMGLLGPSGQFAVGELGLGHDVAIGGVRPLAGQ